MGIYSGPDSQRSLSIPDTPPGLVSPSSSTYSSRTSEDRFWSSGAPVSPPMSSYESRTRPEMAAGKSLEEGQTRRDVPNNAPRHQLPSLSSIFGPPQHIRPLHSPLSDRPSPLYGNHSPLDRPQSASAQHERPYSGSSSYFPNVSPPLGQPLTVYEPRLEPERLTLPSVSRDFPGHLSPRTRDYEPPHRTYRTESTSTARWSHSSHPDQNRPEYVFGSQASPPSFRSVGEHVALPSLSHSLGVEAGSVFRRESQKQQPAHSRAEALTSAATPEGIPGKDGLGPKIWTGTHFLPRFVRQAEVPGEGLCYFYDDGTHCKTVIDGEPVNAHWGVTKAGKPRKRLAIACLTCREKKIKCDPDYPRCVQCEKFGRVCKFKNAPRGGHNTSPITSPAEHDEPRQLGAPRRPTEMVRQRSASSISVSPQTTKLSHPSPELPSLSAKRMRLSYDNYATSTSRSSPTLQAPQIKPTSLPELSWQPRGLPRIHEDILRRPWHTDPRPHARV